jgi:serine/threonine protein kinase
VYLVSCVTCREPRTAIAWYCLAGRCSSVRYRRARARQNLLVPGFGQLAEPLPAAVGRPRSADRRAAPGAGLTCLILAISPPLPPFRAQDWPIRQRRRGGRGAYAGLSGAGGVAGGELMEDSDGLGAAFAANSQVAGYRLEDQIAAGGMAVVFRARDERLGRRVALKIMAPALAADEVFRQRFIRESRAAAAVDDPHIIPVFEAGEANGVLFLAMRYVPGGDVRTLVRREGPMSAARACAIISAVASALDAAHAAGLIHRDVKTANMLVDVRPDRPDHVYLSDFGLSKGELSSSGLTGTGQFLGTVDYCAPEQIEGRAVDGRADQYALACSAFELLTGALPFVRDQATAMIWAHMSQPPPLLTARRPDLPTAADQVLARGWLRHPQTATPAAGSSPAHFAKRWALPHITPVPVLR